MSSITILQFLLILLGNLLEILRTEPDKIIYFKKNIKSEKIFTEKNILLTHPNVIFDNISAVITVSLTEHVVHHVITLELLFTK